MLAHAILAAGSQAWAPFALVVGLLLIGTVAADEDLFGALGARLARARLGPTRLLVALLALVAVVTALLNLDTSVVFLTPVLVHAARERGLDERPFLYGSVFMANAGSLLLPGSNLTNLLLVRAGMQGGGGFAVRMVPAWLAACTVTAVFLALAFRLDDGLCSRRDPPPLRLGVGAAATLVAAALVVLLPNAALPVLAVGIAATALRRLAPRVDTRALAVLFALTVGLGAVARMWAGPAHLLASSGWWTQAVGGAVASVLVNNLPAAVMFSARPPAHPDALLLGLDLGPNLAVTGSLSAVLWLQASRSVGAQASVAVYSRLGLILVPLTIGVAGAVMLIR
jgi:arsenical pump membrane protein